MYQVKVHIYPPIHEKLHNFPTGICLFTLLDMVANHICLNWQQKTSILASVTAADNYLAMNGMHKRYVPPIRCKINPQKPVPSFVTDSKSQKCCTEHGIFHSAHNITINIKHIKMWYLLTIFFSVVRMLCNALCMSAGLCDTQWDSTDRYTI